MEIEYNDLISKEYKGKDPDLKVIKTYDMQLIIDYPLSKPFTFNIVSENGYTRKQLFEHIQKIYTDIYNDKSNKYEIWGNKLEDLYLESVFIRPRKKILTLGIRRC